MANEATAVLLHQLRRLANVRRTEHLSDRELLARFAGNGDAEAFAALVERHGPLVWRVCRRTLAREQDAEDAFQAVFLVLMRKAAGESWQESIAGWLYAVAVRVALKARNSAAARHTSGLRPDARQASVLDELTAREVLAVLDEELARLPEKYRTPVVLCLVNGQTQEEAVRLTGWSLSTMRRRLEHGRSLLERRLTRRGLGLSAGLGVLVMAEASATATVPICIQRTILESAELTAAGKSLTGAFSAATVALADGIGSVTTTIVMAKAVGGLFVMFAVLVAGTSFVFDPADPSPPVARKLPVPLPVVAKESVAPQARVDLQGDPLPEEAVARLGTNRLRIGQGWIYQFAFDPVANTVITLGYDGVRIWDPASGKELHQFNTNGAGVMTSDSALSPDGKLLAVTGRNADLSTSIGIWECATGQQLRSFGTKPKNESCSHLQFTPDSKLVAAVWQGSNDKESPLEIWDAITGGFRNSWQVPKIPFYCNPRFGPEGKSIVTGGVNGSIGIWDVATGQVTRQLDAGPNQVGRLAVSPDGRLVASLSMMEVRNGNSAVFPPENRIRLWDIGSGKELPQLEVPTKEIYLGSPRGFLDMLFSPDGKSLVTTGVDQYLRSWDVTTGRVTRQSAQLCVGSVLTFSPDGRTLACGRKGFHLLDADKLNERVALPGHLFTIRTVLSSADSNILVTSSNDYDIRIWDRGSGRELQCLKMETGFIIRLTMTRDGRSLFGLVSDGTVRLWDLAAGRELKRWPVEIPDVWRTPIALSRDGQTLAIHVKEKTIGLFDVTTGTERKRLSLPTESPIEFDFESSGRTLVAWDGEQKVRLFDAISGQQVNSYSLVDSTGNPLVSPPAGVVMNWRVTVAISSDGKFIAHLGPGNYVAVQDLATGKLVRVIDRLSAPADSMQISGDGRMIALGGWRDPVVHIVEVASGKERHQFVGHRGSISSFTFTGDGQFLVTGSEDTTALVWDLTGRLAANGKWDTPPTSQELDSAWTDLAGSDAAVAWKALQRLAAAPEQSVPFVAKRLAPVQKVDEARITHLIADLDSAEFAVREQATKELEKIGELATVAYRKTLEAQPTLEKRRRVEALLAKAAESRQAPTGDRLCALRAVELLEWVGTSAAKETLDTLAKGAPGASLTEDAKAAVERLQSRSRQ